jgi:hypothetical protein
MSRIENRTINELDVGSITLGSGSVFTATPAIGFNIGTSTIGIDFTGTIPTCIDISAVGTTSSHVIDMIDAYTGMFVETGSYSSVASKGISVSATNNKPVSFLFDDAGVALTAVDHRAVLSRVLLTKDCATTHTLNAIRGQIKMLDLVDLSAAGVNACVQGYAELTGTGARTITGRLACLRAALEEGASGTTTVAASSILCGIDVTLTSTRTYTETGTFAGIYIGISGGTSTWNNGLFLETGGCDVGFACGNAFTGKFIESGTYSSTASNGITLATGANRPVTFVFDDAGAALPAEDFRPVVSRTLLSVDQTATFTLNSVRGQVKMNDLVDLTAASIVAGVGGYAELAGTGARTITGRLAVLRAALEEGASGTTTVAASSILCGLDITLTSGRTTTETGTMAGIYIGISSTAVWPNGIFIEDSSCTLGIDIGTCTSGIDFSGTMTNALVMSNAVVNAINFDAAATDKAIEASVATPAGDTTHCLRIAIGATPYYIPVYAAKTF